MDKSGFNALDRPRMRPRCRAKTVGQIGRLDFGDCSPDYAMIAMIAVQRLNLSFVTSAATKGQISLAGANDYFYERRKNHNGEARPCALDRH